MLGKERTRVRFARVELQDPVKTLTLKLVERIIARNTG